MCYQELGFYANTSYASSSKILTSIKSIDLSGSREIYIRSNLLTRNFNSTSDLNSSTLLDHIWIDCNNFDLLIYTNITRFKTYNHDT